MSFQCGFFNSIDGDRKYNAEQMNNPYHRLISNGVFANPNGTPSTDFQVQAFSGMTIKVKRGEGIFAGKWAKLDSDMMLTLQGDAFNNAYYSVIIRIDTSEEIRAGSIFVRRGSLNFPDLIQTEYIKEYRLANILIEGGAQQVTQADITDTRASSDCGFITHLLKQTDISATYIQWQAQFDEWFQNVKETLSTATLISSYTSRYVTTTQGETQIPIQISQYNRNLDILQVFVNGLRLIPEEEYTVDSNSQITLAADVDINTPVSFIVYKSVDGSEAETVVNQVNTLQRLQMTSDTGSTQLSANSGQDPLAIFVNAGKGMHTMYIQSGAAGMPAVGAYRAIGHLTGETAGWIIALQANGSVFANYLNEGAWRGWRTLYEANPTPLYYSAAGVFPTAGTTITPNKPLSACQHGWQLVFCGYDDVGKVPRDVYVQTYEIPKKNHKQLDWNGESISIPLIYQYVTESDSSLMCQKTLNVYNDRLVGGTTASTGVQRNMVLRAIYEY